MRFVACLASLLAGVLVATACADDARLAPMSLDELRQTRFDVSLSFAGDLENEDGYTAYLVSYGHADLTLYAMVAVPVGDRPEGGFPVVIANHGYVPDPRRYGMRSDGRNARPGDYYASVPGLFASRGFLTVIPDYRGHNLSEGFAYIDPQDERSAAYYAEDVAALLTALDQLDGADTDNVFMWSHSMGGTVSMRVLLASDVVKASSFWSTMDVSEYTDRFAEIDGPVVVHHGRDDAATAHGNSARLAEGLDAAGYLEAFLSYSTDEHYFEGDRRERAAMYDAAFFRAQIQ